MMDKIVQAFSHPRDSTSEKEPILFRSGEGSDIAILPYGGRALGLYSSRSNENFFWTNPALNTERTAQRMFKSEWNTGGDRTWISPEVDYFFKSNNRDYYVPPQLDPGNYSYATICFYGPNSSQIKLGTSMIRLKSAASRYVDVWLTKEFKSEINPLHNDPLFKKGASSPEYAGYLLRTELQIESEDELPVGIWNILQLPSPGTMIIPATSNTHPTPFFGVVSPQDLIFKENQIHYYMHATGAQKIGIRATATTGRMGYMYKAQNEKTALIVRDFKVDPKGTYLDAPWANSIDKGYCAQACHINENGLAYSELEYHAPAIGQGTGRKEYIDVSKLWAFRGTQEDITWIAGRLLGPGA